MEPPTGCNCGSLIDMEVAGGMYVDGAGIKLMPDEGAACNKKKKRDV